VTIEWVVGIGVLSAIVGIGIGYLLFGRGRKKAAELESELESAQNELADYRQEVYGQFSETAEKFKALDRSYQDLHRQLAVSAVALCGDDGTPLLASPTDGAVVEGEASQAQDADVLDEGADTATTGTNDANATDPVSAGEMDSAAVEEGAINEVEGGQADVDQTTGSEDAPSSEAPDSTKPVTDDVVAKDAERASTQAASTDEQKKSIVEGSEAATQVKRDDELDGNIISASDSSSDSSSVRAVDVEIPTLTQARPNPDTAATKTGVSS